MDNKSVGDRIEHVRSLLTFEPYKLALEVPLQDQQEAAAQDKIPLKLGQVLRLSRNQKATMIVSNDSE